MTDDFRKWINLIETRLDETIDAGTVFEQKQKFITYMRIMINRVCLKVKSQAVRDKKPVNDTIYKDLIKDNLTLLIKNYFTLIIKNLELSDAVLDIDFSSNSSGDGHYDFDRRIIKINNRFYDNFIDSITNRIVEKINDFSKVSLFKDDIVTLFLNSLFNVFAHEMIHASQYTQSKFHKNTNKPLEISSNKFADLYLQQMFFPDNQEVQKQLDTAYYSMPIEVEAHANNLLLEILDLAGLGLDDFNPKLNDSKKIISNIEKFEELFANIPRQIDLLKPSYKTNLLIHRSNLPKKAINNFFTKMYKAFVNIRKTIINSLKDFPEYVRLFKH